MPDLELSVRVEVDGVPLSGFPLIRRMSVDRIQGVRPLERGIPAQPIPPAQFLPTDYKSFPSEKVEHPFILAVRVLSPGVAVRVSGETTSDIPLRQGGLILIWNGLCATLPAGVSVLNTSATQDSRINGFVAGAAHA